MGWERDTSRPTDGSGASTKRKPHKHSSKSRSHSRSRNEKKQKRRHRSSSTSTSSSSTSSSSRSHSPAHKKHKKRKGKKTKRHSGEKHNKKHHHHHHRHHHHHHHKKVKDAEPQTTKESTEEEGSVIGPAMPENSSSTNGSKDTVAGVTRTLTPMTKEEWDKKQSEVRRVYDPETGRHRLVRGEGEIIEEIVSRDRHKQINKQATQGDGLFYQQQAGLAKH